MRITGLVKALLVAPCFALAMRKLEPRGFWDGTGEWTLVDDRRGEPSVVLYPGGSSSSSSNERRSSRFASPPFAKTSPCDPRRENLLSIHWPVSRPISLRNLFSSCVSSRKRMPITTPQASMIVQTRLGSRNGNLSNKVPRGKIDG